MKMSNSIKKQLLRKAHELHPIVIIGAKGLTDSVQLEIERALIDHELVKIKISCGDRNEREGIVSAVCQERNAELIQQIGKTAVIYRKNSSS